MQKVEFHTSLNLCKVCPHHNQVDDDREGNVVCTDCGLVIEPIYQNLTVNYNKNNVFRHNNKGEKIVTTLLVDQKNIAT